MSPTLKKDYLGHRKRLRGRFLQGSITAFNDYEIIEYFLTFSIPVKDVKPLAKRLIHTFKNIAAFLDADAEQLRSVHGMGEATVSSVLFFRALIEQYFKEHLKRDVCLPSTERVSKFLQASFRGKKVEVFKVLFLNNRNKLIAERTIQEGTVDQAAVYPREIIMEALRIGATRLICAHNHPSGDTRPSEADYHITRKLIAAAAPLDIDILEHIIVGEDTYYSFAESGLIRQYYRMHEEHRKEPCIK